MFARHCQIKCSILLGKKISIIARICSSLCAADAFIEPIVTQAAAQAESRGQHQETLADGYKFSHTRTKRECPLWEVRQLTGASNSQVGMLPLAQLRSRRRAWQGLWSAAAWCAPEHGVICGTKSPCTHQCRAVTSSLLFLKEVSARRQGASCRQAAVEGCHIPTPYWTRQILAGPNLPWARMLSNYNAPASRGNPFRLSLH